MKFHGQGTGLELRSAALDRMYGEGLSTALAVHLLRAYGAAVLGPKRQYGGLPREKLVRAVEYIQDQLDTDRIELIEKRGGTDPTLQHIALALLAGVQSGDALDHMYGEGLSTALAAHLLREYGAAVLEPKRQYGGLPRAKLVRALEYIQDQLDADLTVSGIAQAVDLSPYHFTRLFKESTGQSPHQYVVDARVRKAKELLTTGKFTISEAAFHLGFADQSHLTRHFKRVFGLPPKRLLNRRRPQIVL